MADYTQPPVVEKRVRFFDGQFLLDQDFIDEQKYHLDREHRQNRLLHVTGIADGLQVSASKTNQLIVSKGIAVDSLGRQLVLAEDRTVDLPAAKFNNQQGVSLYMLYQETPVDLATTGSKSERRWLETPQIVAATTGGESTEPWDNQTIPVLLARLNLDNNGTVTVDVSATQYAGLSLSGNVGIGTTDPGNFKLNVQGGNTNLGGNLTVQGITDFAGNTFAHGNLQVDGTSAFAGSVGIGTTTPENADRWNRVLDLLGSGTAKLSVRTANIDARILANDAGWWNAPAGMIVGTQTNHPLSFGTNSATRMTISATGSMRLELGKDQKLSLGGNGTFEMDAPGMVGGRFVITDGGNVGIGTPGPASKLHIFDGNPGKLSPYYGYHLRADSAADTGLLLSTPQANSAYIYHNTPLDGASAGIKFDGNSRSMSFFTVNGTERMRIDANGYVGIGTSTIHNPQGWNKVVDILGTTHARLNVRSSGGVITSVFSHDNWNGARGVIGTESNHPLTFATGYAHRMTIDTNGYVGIGTPTPKYPLHIVGGAPAWANFPGNGVYPGSSLSTCGLYIEGAGGGASMGWHVISDARVKCNPTSVDPMCSLATLADLTLYEYEYIPEYQPSLSGQKYHGFLAQEVEKVIPAAVSILGDHVMSDGQKIEGLRVVAHDRIFSETVGAIQALYTLLQKQEARIRELEGQSSGDQADADI